MNSLQNNTLSFNYFDSFTSDDVTARQTQLKEFTKSSGFASATKSLPKHLQGEVKKASKALSGMIKKLHSNHSSLAWPKHQETVAQKALSYNRVVKGSDGVSTVPIGLIALSLLKKPRKELVSVREKVAEMTVSQTFAEYQKYKLAQVESMQKLESSVPQAVPQKEEKAPVIAESPATKPVLQKEEQAPIKAEVETPEETSTEITSKEATEAREVREVRTEKREETDVSDIEEKREVEETARRDDKRDTRLKENKREAKTTKKKGFFSFFKSFFSVFKNLFLGFFKFFSGKKSK